MTNNTFTILEAQRKQITKLVAQFYDDLATSGKFLPEPLMHELTSDYSRILTAFMLDQTLEVIYEKEDD